MVVSVVVQWQFGRSLVVTLVVVWWHVGGSWVVVIWQFGGSLVVVIWQFGGSLVAVWW